MTSIERGLGKLFAGIMTITFVYFMLCIPNVDVILLQGFNNVTKPLGFDMTPLIASIIILGIAVILIKFSEGIEDILGRFSDLANIFR